MTDSIKESVIVVNEERDGVIPLLFRLASSVLNLVGYERLRFTVDEFESYISEKVDEHTDDQVHSGVEGVTDG